MMSGMSRSLNPRIARCAHDAVKDSTAAWIAEGGLKHPRVHAQLGLHKH